MVLHFGTATRIFLQTLPYVLLRIGVGVLFGLFTVLYFGIALGAMYFAASLGGELSIVVIGAIFLVSLGVFFKLVSILRTYVLYLVSAGHVATIAHVVDTGTVPDNQLAFGKEQVTDHFVEASALAVVDQLIKGVLNQFNGAVVSLSKFVGLVPALRNVITILRKAITIAGNHLDEAVLAHVFLHDSTNNWAAARDGLVLYAKTWKSVLGSAVLIVFAMYAIDGALLLSLGIVALVVADFSLLVQGTVLLAGIGIVATVHFGIVGPWVKTVIITTYLLESQDETPDSETMDFIEERSSKFRELAENATAERTRTGSTGTTGIPRAGERPR